MEPLDSFDEWLAYQQIDRRTLDRDAEAVLRGSYQQARAARDAIDVNALVRRPPRVGEFRYAVAIEDGENLWLTLWVRRSPSGECFVVYPRGRGGGNPHASYHRDGKYYQKSHDHKFAVQQRQPLDQFKGAEHLGSFGGHGPGSAICQPASFSSVLRVPPGVLTDRAGCVLVDLVKPGVAPAAHHRAVAGLRIVLEETYRDYTPWAVIAVAEQTPVGTAARS